MELCKRKIQGVIALACFALFSMAASPAGNRTPQRPHIVIISIDTLRPDHLGLYGYFRNTSPGIDRLAQTGLVFEQCMAQASWTPPSVASLFTSLYPPQHGSLGKDRVVLPEDNLTMAEILGEAGYFTAAFSASPFIHPDFGFGQGFESFMFDGSEDAKNLTDMVQDWLQRLNGTPSRPVFLYIMYFDPHYPYEPPAPYNNRFRTGPDQKTLWEPEKLVKIPGLFDLGATIGRHTFERLRSLYDGEIAYTDRRLQDLLEALQEAGLLDPRGSILVITSDHGEEFLEHAGFGHGNTLYQEVISVPLFIRAHGAAAGKRVRAVVRQIDVMPTMLELAGVDPPAKIEGKSLVPVMREPGSAKDRPAFAACWHLFHQGHVMKSLLKENKKIILSKNPDRAELYDLWSDPGEQRDLAGKRPRLLQEMTDELMRFERDMLTVRAKRAAAKSPSRTRDLLESLGYIQR